MVFWSLFFSLPLLVIPEPPRIHLCVPTLGWSVLGASCHLVSMHPMTLLWELVGTSKIWCHFWSQNKTVTSGILYRTVISLKQGQVSVSDSCQSSFSMQHKLQTSLKVDRLWREPVEQTSLLMQTPTADIYAYCMTYSQKWNFLNWKKPSDANNRTRDSVLSPLPVDVHCFLHSCDLVFLREEGQTACLLSFSRGEELFDGHWWNLCSSLSSCAAFPVPWSHPYRMLLILGTFLILVCFSSVCEYRYFNNVHCFGLFLHGQLSTGIKISYSLFADNLCNCIV